MIRMRSAIISPRSSDSRRIGVMSRRSKYPFWMSVTSALARERPVTAKMIATGNWNALKSRPVFASASGPNAPMLIV